MVSSFEFSGNTVGVLVKEDMDEILYDEVRVLLEEKIKEFGKINLFLEIERGYEISFKAMWNHLKFSIQHDNGFSKIAVVTDKELFRKALVLKDLLTKAEVDYFTHQDRIKAMQWVVL